MVTWSEYYRFSAEEVEAIGTTDIGSGTHPFMLTVYFKSGNKLSISYENEKHRKAALIDLARQVDAEKRRDAEKIHIALSILQGGVNRMEKRQLRIWRQLKELLGLKVDGEGEEGGCGE